MVAANALDLGSCWITQLKWLNEDPDLLALFRSLGMREDERIYGAVSLGYAATDSGLPSRRRMPQKGNVVAFVVALLAMKWFVAFLTKYGFRVFGIYRIIAGGTILLLMACGVSLTV